MVRFKSRYLVFQIYYPHDCPPTAPTFQIPSPSTANERAIAQKLRESIALHFGDLGAGRTGALSVKFFSPTTSRGIIRCARDQFRTVWAAITFLNEFQGRTAVFRVVRASGTIRKAELECIRRNKAEGRKMLEGLEGLLEGGVGIDQELDKEGDGEWNGEDDD